MAQGSRLLHHLDRLRRDLGTEARSDLARDVAAIYVDQPLRSRERTLANQIIEILAQDVAVQVRAALSEQIAQSPLLPPRLARKMARDVDAVACPVLQHTPVLSDSDLIAIVREATERKLLAITHRDAISDRVGRAVIDCGSSEVAASLVANQNAQLSPDALGEALARHGGNEALQLALLDRSGVPSDVVIGLIERISQGLLARLVQEHDLAPDLARDVAQRAEEAAIADWTAPGGDSERLAGLVSVLHRRGKLTPLFLLRALITRRLELFYAAMSRLSGLATAEVEGQLVYGDAHERRMVHGSAGLPEPLFSAFNAALALLRESRVEGEAIDQPAFEAQVIARIARAYPTVAPTNLDNVLAQLGQSVLGDRGVR